MAERTQWNSNLAFLMAMIGSAVGLGNIWRFPYIFYTSGQGSFLIPYLVAIFVLGLPFLLLEYSLGVKYKDTTLNIMDKINGKFKIVAFALLIVTFIITCYYTCIVGWDLIYIFLSFTKAWGSNPDAFFSNFIQHTPSYNQSIFEFVPIVVVSVLIIWAIVWLISRKGLNNGIGKFSKVAVPLLFALIVIIVVFSVILPGSSAGLVRFLQPDWAMLATPDIWLAAFGQIIFSLSLGMGITLTFASYLPDNTNLTKNAVTVISANCGFEVFNAIGVFGILGFMTTKTGIPFDSLITGGSGLAFVAYPNVFNVMGVFACIMGPLFFLCILIAGLTSIISLLESSVAPIVDRYGVSRKRTLNLFVIVGVLISLCFATSYSDVAITTVDFIANNLCLLILVALECLIYGYNGDIDALAEVLNQNTLFKVGDWWKFLIKYVLPIILFILWASGVFTIPFINNYISWAVVIVVLIICLSIPFFKSHIADGIKS